MSVGTTFSKVLNELNVKKEMPVLSFSEEAYIAFA